MYMGSSEAETMGSVLLIEDDNELVALFETVLRKARCQFTAAGTLADAQDLLAEDHFDVAICDLSVIGEANLGDTISNIRAEQPNISILIATGFAPARVVASLNGTGVDILEKPFTPVDLVSRISALLQSKAA